MTSRSFKGEAVSPGIAIGTLCWLAAARVGDQTSRTDVNQADQLRAAITAAIAQLRLLASSLSGDEAELIEFQIAMLADDALSEQAFLDISQGMAAVAAWQKAMDRQIEEYAASEDDYFKARAADLSDIHERVLVELIGGDQTGQSIPPGAVIAAHDLTPSRFLQTDWDSGGGVVLTEGSAMSHVAILARARGVPMVIGVADLDAADTGVEPSVRIAIDGGTGEVCLQPDDAVLQRFAKRSAEQQAHQHALGKYLEQDAATADGHQVDVCINVAHESDVDHVNVAHCNGIGLMRTEFLFGNGLPDEETQFRAYRHLLSWAAGKPVTIRTLDAGGDKPVANLTVDGERNPFLGQRGIRLCFQHPDVFMVQCRALCRAAAHGNLKVMFPMIATTQEYARAEQFVFDALDQLRREHIVCRRPVLGMMVEVPAAAICIDAFDKPAFFSIGSNDLLQYLSATSRDDPSLRDIAEDCQPAMLVLIEQMMRIADERNQEVSFCGDLASQPKALAPLLRTGLRTISVAPAKLAEVKAAIGKIDTVAAPGVRGAPSGV